MTTIVGTPASSLTQRPPAGPAPSCVGPITLASRPGKVRTFHRANADSQSLLGQASMAPRIGAMRGVSAGLGRGEPVCLPVVGSRREESLLSRISRTGGWRVRLPLACRPTRACQVRTLEIRTGIALQSAQGPFSTTLSVDGLSGRTAQTLFRSGCTQKREPAAGLLPDRG